MIFCNVGIFFQAATGVYDSLLRDIERAQAELSAINTALTNTGLYQVATLFTPENLRVGLNIKDNPLQATNEVAAAVLRNEVDELKQTKVEGLSEDPEMRFITLG